MADVKGRRVTYIVTFIVFIGACIGTAESKYYYQLLILRCLQSTGSASTIAIGAGMVGDITTREDRGGYMGIFQAGLLVPLAIGPVLGGVFAQTLGWRAIFWFLTIYAAAFLVVLVFVLPETLRSMVGNGSIPAKGLSQSLLGYIQQRRHPTAAKTIPDTPSNGKKAKIDVLGPLKIILSVEVSFVIAFLSIHYMVWQMSVAASSTLFKETYGLSEIQIGLTYISNGAGCILATLTIGKFLDFEYRRTQAKFTGDPKEFPLERARLRTLWLWSAIECASVLVFGWTIQYSIHISVPIICSFFIGWAATCIYSIANTYLVDVFTHSGASATAALNLARCLVGAGGTAAILPLANAI
ncbi:hypothetical protein LTS18_014940, partial [Coniosporium uncinatum]